ncbi:MAG: hypothetical protein II919_03890 [Lachnospiraceae bacterium]|nr:hypothetical protein [Lachnospiraceae bacterium]
MGKAVIDVRLKNREILIKFLTVSFFVFTAVCCHSVARRIEMPVISRFLNFIRTSIYVGMFSVWGVSVYHRLVQVQVRRYLVFVSALMVFWMILREVKYRFIINPDAERYLWYMYYIPILVTPMIALFVSVLPGKSEADRLPGWSSFFYLPTVILILLFLTNDLHQWAFCFPKEASVWTEHGKYRYGIVFYLAIVWGVFCSLTAMTIMILKSRLPKLHGFFWLPFVPIVVVMIYVVAYALRVPMVAELGDIAAFESLLFTAFFEICILLGLIPSNTGYYDLFCASKELSMQIVDNHYAVCYAASGTEPFEKEELIRAQECPIVTKDGKRLHNMPIRGGHAVWIEEISELLKLTETLKNVQAELYDRNEIIRMEYREEHERKRVEEQNRLLDLLQSATQTQIDKVKELTESYPLVKNQEEKHKIIAKIVVLGSFIKRRKDFLLSLEDSPTLSVEKLSNAFDESYRSLRLYGISGGYTVYTGRTDVSGELLTLAYDFFEDVLECIIDKASCFNVSVADVGGCLRCSVLTDCESDFICLTEKYPAMRMECDEGDSQLILPLEGGRPL